MSEKRELIDQLIHKTGIDPYKLKRLASNELEKLLTAFKRTDGKIEDLILEIEEKNSIQ